MAPLIYILLAVFGLAAVGAAVSFIYKRDETSSDLRKKGLRSRDRQAVIRQARRRLEQNPKDPGALQALADLYYRDQEHAEALRYYQPLVKLCATVPELNEFEITLHYALSALKLKDLETAYQNLVIASTLDDSNFEVNFNLGVLEYERKNYQRAVVLLRKARALEAEHVETNRYLGHTLFRLRKSQEAVPCLKRTLDYMPEDKETLFMLGQAYYSLAQHDQALKIFTHLRMDPVLGARSSLYSGTLYVNARNHQKAAMDFEIGLRHPNTPPDILLELKYRLAACYLALGQIGQSIRLWNEIRGINPDYKDVVVKLEEYQEISANQGLQVFLMAPTSEFVTLCRKLASSYFPRGSVKLVDIQAPRNEYVDMLAEVSGPQWEELTLFRFIRSAGQIGELMLRELYARSKELRAGRGVCISAGDYTESARAFVDARLIDLVDKKALLKLFHRLPGTQTAVR